MTVPSRIRRLAALAEKPSRRVVGLMSGTSLDGLDIALCSIAGGGAETRVTLDRFLTRPYSVNERERLRSVVFRDQVSLEELCVLNAWLAEIHGRAVLAALNEWEVKADEVDLLASHGQTVFHAPASWSLDAFRPEDRLAPRGSHGPARHATLQLGDGDLLAGRTGILTVSDFRQKEIAGGGQGAPLAPYAEALLYTGPESRVLLNLGGIANFTWLPPRGSNEMPISGDTGPGNTLLDLTARHAAPDGPGYDPGGAAAARGRVHPELLLRLKAHPFFSLSFPKSTGPEVFGEGYLLEALELSGTGAAWSTAAHGSTGRTDDLAATLTRLTVDTIVDALRREVPQFARVHLYVSGGGRHNRTLMAWLEQALPEIDISDSSALGIPPDAKEAVLFAVLGNEAIAGPGFSAADGSGRRLAFGKLSFPD